MQYRLFQYPLPASPDLSELNVFLAQHRVASVTQYLATVAGGSVLVFVVATVAPTLPPESGGRGKIDYRAELDDKDFAVFSTLRSWRKAAAETEGVPVYTLFSNAQLAELARRRPTTPTELREMAGLGAARIEKYGEALLAILCAAGAPPSST